MDFYTNVINYGNTLFIRKIQDGKSVLEKEQNFHPVIFVPAKNKSTPSEYKTISGYPVVRFDAGNIKETRNFIERNKNVDNFSIYGNIQPKYQWIHQHYGKSDIEYDISKINVCYIDIEVGKSPNGGYAKVETPDGEILSISVKFSNLERKVVFGRKDFTGALNDAVHIKCSSEEVLFQKFVDLFSKNCPDIITGWNVKFFDIPYFINRASMVMGEDFVKRLSPWKIINSDTEFYGNREFQVYNIFGVSILDYIELYKKFTYTTRDSYSLQNIVSIELGESKVDYSEHHSLQELYELDYDKFIVYNLKDIELVLSLEEKLKLIELAITMAYDAKINFDDVFSQIRMWDSIIYNHLMNKKIVVPEKKDTHQKQIEGAFVATPIPGNYEWVVSFDLQSLYPHLILTFNISPDTYIDKRLTVDIDTLINKTRDNSYLHQNDITMTPNGQLFHKKHKGFMAELMDWMFSQRKEYKKTYLDIEKKLEELKNKNSPEEESLQRLASKFNNLQMAKKIALNSAYGCMANQHFRFYNPYIAEGITTAGQLSLRWIMRKLNEHLNDYLQTKDVAYVIYGDTDSCYISLKNLVEKKCKGKSTDEIRKYISEFCSQNLMDCIKTSYKELTDYMNAFENRLVMKLEVISDRSIWLAKKKYAMNVLENEGIVNNPPKLKMMGIEAVRSSTPKICRTELKEKLKTILSGDKQKLIQEIEEFKKIFINSPIKDISFPRGVSDLDAYKDPKNIYKKGTPIHTRGSLLYNKYLKDLGLEGKHREINNGDKIRFVYLKTPNPIHENVIAFHTELPEEFGLNEYIDYELQFEKTFLSPLTLITNAINWDLSNNRTLEEFFN